MRRLRDYLVPQVQVVVNKNAHQTLGHAADPSHAHVQVSPGKSFAVSAHLQPSAAEVSLARWLLRNPRVASSHVIDVNTGPSAVCALAALSACAAYTALYDEPAYADSLEASVQRNASRVIVERLRVCNIRDVLAREVQPHSSAGCNIARVPRQGPLLLVRVAGGISAQLVRRVATEMLPACSSSGALLAMISNDGHHLAADLQALGASVYRDEHIAVVELHKQAGSAAKV